MIAKPKLQERYWIRVDSESGYPIYPDSPIVYGTRREIPRFKGEYILPVRIVPVAKKKSK